MKDPSVHLLSTETDITVTANSSAFLPSLKITNATDRNDGLSNDFTVTVAIPATSGHNSSALDNDCEYDDEDCWNDNDDDDDIDSRSSCSSSSNSSSNSTSPTTFEKSTNDPDTLPLPDDVDNDSDVDDFDLFNNNNEWTFHSSSERRSSSPQQLSFPSSTSTNDEAFVQHVPLKYDRALECATDNSKNDDSCEISYPPKKRFKSSLMSLYDSPADTTTTTSDATSSNYKKRIQFKEMVDVISIPNHTEYSNEVKSLLWSSVYEIQCNAARNTIEFAHEGWNWETVLVEEEMIHCTVTNQYIHPAHYSTNANNNSSSVDECRRLMNEEIIC